MISSRPHPDAPADARRAELLAGLHEDNRVVSEHAARRGLEPVMALSLTVQQLKLLMLVVTQAPVGAHRVAEELGLTPATVSGSVDRLVERGLVVRDHDPADRRLRPLRATEEGVRVIESLTELGALHEQRVLSRLATDDLAALARGMRAVRRVVEDLDAAES
jgi:DNA-binding MarR family transcriptional regulator